MLMDVQPMQLGVKQAGVNRTLLASVKKQNWASLVMSCAKAHHSVKSTGNHEERNTKVNMVKQRYSVCMGE